MSTWDENEKRLREFLAANPQEGHGEDWWETPRQALSEIDHLRAENDKLKTEWESMSAAYELKITNERKLEAQNRMMREALHGALITMQAWAEALEKDPCNNDNYCRVCDCLAKLEEM